MRLCQYISFLVLYPQGNLSPWVTPLGLLLNQAKDAFARGIAEKALTDLLVEELTGVATLIARSFSTTGIDGSGPITKHRGADTTM